MPAHPPAGAPSLEIVRKAVPIAGAAAAALRAPAAEAPGYRRTSLRHSRARKADGSPHPLALSRFRNAQFAPSAGDPAPVGLGRLPGLSVFGGVLGRDFGHVVTQSIGRLWAGSLAPGAPILFLPETAEVTGIPAYFTDLARGLGVSNALCLVTTATLCNRLLVPEDICNLVHRPSASRFFVDWLAQNRARPDPPAAGTGRVYVSRSGLDLTNGRFLQEAALEQALAANGYLVFHPEDHPVARQIEVYQSARHLIFADGSAAHLWSLVARPGQAAAVILRRPLDRPFERWFRSVGCARPALVDGAGSPTCHGVARDRSEAWRSWTWGRSGPNCARWAFTTTATASASTGRGWKPGRLPARPRLLIRARHRCRWTADRSRSLPGAGMSACARTRTAPGSGRTTRPSAMKDAPDPGPLTAVTRHPVPRPPCRSNEPPLPMS